MGMVFNMVGGGGGGIKLTAIRITAPPIKTLYMDGESFNPDGMTVEATYSNGATLIATGWSYAPTGPMSYGISQVIVSYTEAGVSKVAVQAITVLPALSSISVTAKPTKLTYEYGESIDTSGMVVAASYSDGSAKAVTGYSTDPNLLQTLGAQTITVSYTERGATKQDTFQVMVDRAKIALPTQSGTLTYSGAVLSPSWNGYDPAKMTISGTTSSINAGNYTATFTPTSNYRWQDGSTSGKGAAWSIGKAAGSLSINPTSLSLGVSAPSGSISVTKVGNGAITAVSSNTSVATVSVSGNTVTGNNVGQTNGSATITVNVAAGTNHTSPAAKTCSVTASFLDPVLNNNTWEEISAASSAGTAANYWKVGDWKEIKMAWRVGTVAVGGMYRVFILGFNHNYGLEGNSRIHFQFGKTTSGADICFVDSKYGASSSDGSPYFNMNRRNDTNTGGWASSDMRHYICGQILGSADTFISALPDDLRAALKTVTKYSDNKGGGGQHIPDNVSATTDLIFLLSEFEVQGKHTYANSYEQNYQKQYDYYKNGNSKVKYKHSSTQSPTIWWLRSVWAATSNAFCTVNDVGNADARYAETSYGVAPAFCV